MEIRELRPHEHDAWLTLRERLWPDLSRQELARKQVEILADRNRSEVGRAVLFSKKLDR